MCFIDNLGRPVALWRAAVAVVVNRVEIDRDRLAFLQNVELKNRLPIKIFFVRIIARPICFFRRQGGRKAKAESRSG